MRPILPATRVWAVLNLIVSGTPLILECDHVC